MEFNDAVEKDKRPFYKNYFDLVSEKQIIVSTIVNSSVFYPLTMRVIMLVFTIMGFSSLMVSSSLMNTSVRTTMRKRQLIFTIS